MKTRSSEHEVTWGRDPPRRSRRRGSLPPWASVGLELPGSWKPTSPVSISMSRLAIASTSHFSPRSQAAASTTDLADDAEAGLMYLSLPDPPSTGARSAPGAPNGGSLCCSSSLPTRSTATRVSGVRNTMPGRISAA